MRQQRDAAVNSADRANHHFAHERRIRDVYASPLSIYRPSERLVSKEVRYVNAARRVDMRTVDDKDLIRDWEFKVHADHRALGQVLII